jgi:hypothetical protein
MLEDLVTSTYLTGDSSFDTFTSLLVHNRLSNPSLMKNLQISRKLELF